MMKPTKEETEFFNKGFQDALLLMRSAINEMLKDKKNLGDVKLEANK